MKKLITILLLSASVAMANDTLELYNLWKSTKSIQEAKNITETIEQSKLITTASKFAELRLWVLRQTKPKIFIQIETAENATDMGYFRIDFNKANNLKKLELLNEIF